MRRKKTQIDTLRQYLEIAIAVALAIAFAVIRFPEFSDMIEADPIKGILVVTLFAVTCVWFAGWVYFDYQELMLFDEYIETDRLNKRLRLGPFASMLLVAVVCGVLLAVSRDLQLYAPLVMLNWLVAGAGDSIVHKKLLRIYTDLEDDEVKPIHIICEYYLYRPFFVLHVSAIVSLVVAFIFYWYSLSTGNNYFLYSGYVVCILAVVIHETVLWYWRFKRDRRIEEIEDAMSESVQVQEMASKMLKETSSPETKQPNDQKLAQK